MWTTMRVYGWTLLCALVVLAWPLNAQALAPGHTAQVLVSQGDTVSGHVLIDIFQDLALTETGEVWYLGRFPNFGFGLFSTTSGVRITNGDTIQGTTIVDFTAPLVAPNGTLLFGCRSPVDAGICTPTMRLVKSGDVIGGLAVIPLAAAANNTVGVTFVASYAGGSGVFRLRPNQVLARSGTPIGGVVVQDVLGVLDANSSGQVVFQGETAGGHAIFTPSRFLAGVGTPLGDVTPNAVGQPVIDEVGHVILYAHYPGGAGLWVTNVGTPHWLLKTGDLLAGEPSPITDVADAPAVSGDGEVAFLVTLASGRKAIGTMDQGLVLTEGDIVDGKTIASLANPSINASGQLATRVRWQNATLSEAIVLVSPQPLKDRRFPKRDLERERRKGDR